MFKRMLPITLVLASALSLGGCLPTGSDTSTGNSGPVQVQATPEQIVETIKKMSADPETYGNSPERHILAQQLAQMGPTTLVPLVDFMGAPDTAQKARLFVLQCLSDHLSAAYISTLKPLLESTDQVTRAIGVMALAHIKDPSVVQLLTVARKDPSPHVSFSALSGLAMQGDPAARQELRQMYSSGTTMGDIRIEDVKREVVRVLLRDATPEDLAVLQDALNQPFIEINARFMIAETLGRLGDLSAIPLLEQSLNLQKEPEYGEMVQQAIATINERQGYA
jgi:HEAT repeat protein